MATAQLDQGRETYAAALRAGDARAALQTIDRLIDEGSSFEEICERVIRPALYDVGDLWADGTITVADEHLATAISETVLACVGSFSSAPPDAEPRVLVSCTEGETHAVAARMVGEVLAAADWSVRYLGASTPSHALAEAVVAREVDVLALSTTMPENLPAVRATIAAVREAAPGVRVVVGGQAYRGEAERARAVGADALLDSLEGLHERIEELLAA